MEYQNRSLGPKVKVPWENDVGSGQEFLNSKRAYGFFRELKPLCYFRIILVLIHIFNCFYIIQNINELYFMFYFSFQF